jgi:GT2 family glycosyltransferase
MNAQAITVVICTYNRAQSLARTLTSLQEMSVPPDLSWELIVVDNNSHDDTRRIVHDFIRSSELPLRYVWEGTQGLCRARNTGIKEARGEIVAFGLCLSEEPSSNMIASGLVGKSFRCGRPGSHRGLKRMGNTA